MSNDRDESRETKTVNQTCMEPPPEDPLELEKDGPTKFTMDDLVAPGEEPTLRSFQKSKKGRKISRIISMTSLQNNQLWSTLHEQEMPKKSVPADESFAGVMMSPRETCSNRRILDCSPSHTSTPPSIEKAMGHAATNPSQSTSVGLGLNLQVASLSSISMERSPEIDELQQKHIPSPPGRPSGRNARSCRGGGQPGLRLPRSSKSLLLDDSSSSPRSRGNSREPRSRGNSREPRSRAEPAEDTNRKVLETKRHVRRLRTEGYRARENPSFRVLQTHVPLVHVVPDIVPDIGNGVGRWKTELDDEPLESLSTNGLEEVAKVRARARARLRLGLGRPVRKPPTMNAPCRCRSPKLKLKP